LHVRPAFAEAEVLALDHVMRQLRRPLFSRLTLKVLH
jgi:hypothetical protein